jgi:hypothetical protein
MPRRSHALTRLLIPAVLLAALFHAHSVRAEARVTGQPDNVRVEARDSSVEEVLAALGASFGLRYRSTASLGRRITGTYAGSLQRVVTRLLNGYDFVMKTDSGSVEVAVYGVANPEALPAPKSVQAPTVPQAARTPQAAQTPQAAKAARKKRRERRRLVK